MTDALAQTAAENARPWPSRQDGGAWLRRL